MKYVFHPLDYFEGFRELFVAFVGHRTKHYGRVPNYYWMSFRQWVVWADVQQTRPTDRRWRGRFSRAYLSNVRYAWWHRSARDSVTNRTILIKKISHYSLWNGRRSIVRHCSRALALNRLPIPDDDQWIGVSYSYTLLNLTCRWWVTANLEISNRSNFISTRWKHCQLWNIFVYDRVYRDSNGV